MTQQLNDIIKLFVDEKVINTSLEQIMGDCFGRYSKYIIQERALPDVRDGLKPVQRRILYGMNQMGVGSSKPYKKSARITGEVMGKYHPHGDSSIYEALVRMSQDFKMLVPLIDMHGNNGSIDGDSPAAMRYTETRLSRAAEVLLTDLEKRTVSFIPNFDDQELEPTVLPAKFPNLLVNGSYGIAAGYATKIPPHNLSEVINATIMLLRNPQTPLSKLMTAIKGPDFPTGGIVQGRDEIISAFKTGVGKIVLRGKVNVKQIETGPQILITEIPYEVNKANLVHAIDALRANKTLEDILEVRDETDQKGLQIAIDLKPKSDPNVVLSYLYKNTELQVYYNYNMTSIIDRKPQLTGIVTVLNAYINHQREVITNRSNFLLEKAEKRKHIVVGLIKMVSVLDEVIKIIRQSLNKTNAKENLMVTFDFSELQAEAIVTLQLYRLSSTDIEQLRNELVELDKEIKSLELILNSDQELVAVIERELREVQGLLGTKRKTEIQDKIETIKIDEKELISNEAVMVGVTKEGYISRSTIKSHLQTKVPGLKKDDAFLYEDQAQTLDTLLIFTNFGNYIFLPVYKLDDQKWGDLGTFMGNIVPVKTQEKPIKVLRISNFDTNQDILLATKKAMMKQIKLRDMLVSRYSKPIKCISLGKGDELLSVDIDTRPNIIALSKKGFVLRFKTNELPQYGLQASGVKSVNIQPNDELAGACFIADSDYLIALSSRGHIMCEQAGVIPQYNRNRKGIQLIEQPKTSPHLFVDIVSLSKAQEKDNCKVNIITTKKNIYLTPKELKTQQNKYGKKVVNADDGEPLDIIIKKSLNDIIYEAEKRIIRQPKPKPSLGEAEYESDNNLDIFDSTEELLNTKFTPTAESEEESEDFDYSQYAEGGYHEEEGYEAVGIDKEIDQQVNEQNDAYLETRRIAEEIAKGNVDKIEIKKLNLFDDEE